MQRMNMPLRAVRAITCVALAMLCMTSVATAALAPEPGPTPPRWELKFEVTQDLRLINVEGRMYWFMTYMVTNRTKQDQIFAPRAVLFTNKGDIEVAGAEIPYEVTKYMLDLIGNPLLESDTAIIGPLLQGKENAREGIFLWPAENFDIDEVSIFITGLSSESQLVENPYTGKKVEVRKTLERRYQVPGDPLANIQKPGKFRKQRWIMR